MGFSSSRPATTELKHSLYFISRPFDLGPRYRALLLHNFHFWCQKTNISRVRRSGDRPSCEFRDLLRYTKCFTIEMKKKKQVGTLIVWWKDIFLSLFLVLSFARARSEHYHFSCSLFCVHASSNANACASSIKSITCSNDSSRMISTTVTVHSAKHNLHATRCHFSRPLKEKLHRCHNLNKMKDRKISLFTKRTSKRRFNFNIHDFDIFQVVLSLRHFSHL